MPTVYRVIVTLVCAITQNTTYKRLCELSRTVQILFSGTNTMETKAYVFKKPPSRPKIQKVLIFLLYKTSEVKQLLFVL